MSIHATTPPATATTTDTRRLRLVPPPAEDRRTLAPDARRRLDEDTAVITAVRPDGPPPAETAEAPAAPPAPEPGPLAHARVAHVAYLDPEAGTWWTAEDGGHQLIQAPDTGDPLALGNHVIRLDPTDPPAAVCSCGDVLAANADPDTLVSASDAHLAAVLSGELPIRSDVCGTCGKTTRTQGCEECSERAEEANEEPGRAPAEVTVQEDPAGGAPLVTITAEVPLDATEDATTLRLVTRAHLDEVVRRLEAAASGFYGLEQDTTAHAVQAIAMDVRAIMDPDSIPRAYIPPARCVVCGHLPESILELAGLEDVPGAYRCADTAACRTRAGAEPEEDPDAPAPEEGPAPAADPIHQANKCSRCGDTPDNPEAALIRTLSVAGGPTAPVPAAARTCRDTAACAERVRQAADTPDEDQDEGQGAAGATNEE